MKALHSNLAADRIIFLAQSRGYKTLLDIGCGKLMPHALYFKEAGMKVTTVDYFDEADYVGDFNIQAIDQRFDVVWASHVLEHQLNVNAFLTKVFSLLQPEGVACLTVPPLKHSIVGGHVSLWNAGILIYNVILAGNSCAKCCIKTYGYNISLIVEKSPINLPALKCANGDIETLSQYFPFKVAQGFNGQIRTWNWD